MNPITTLVNSRLGAFEREWGYDASYMRTILASGLGAMRALLGIERISKFRKGIPVAPSFAAKIVAARAEDCGPCVQLVVDMAARAGVPAATLRAIVANEHGAMPQDVRLVVRFTEAVLAHAPEADGLRGEIAARWGNDAVVSLAFAILSGRAYPTLKYALGYGKTCTRVHVAGEAVPAAAPAHAHA
jgi:hypothetical protein